MDPENNSQALGENSTQLEPPQFNYNDPNGNPTPAELNADPQSLKEVFLKGVNQQDLPILQKYVAQWDSAATKKFQEIHNQYNWVKELGEQEELRNAVQLFSQLNEDPVGTYQKIKMGLTQMFGDDFENANGSLDEPIIPEPTNLSQNLPENQGIPREFLDRYNQLEQFVTALGQDYLSKNEQAQIEADNKAFDSMLGDLHTRHGKFDDDYVTLLISKGKSPEEAVQGYKDFVAEATGSRKPIPPSIPTGSAGVIPSNGQAGPNGKQPMTDAQRKAYVQSLIEAQMAG